MTTHTHTAENELLEFLIYVPIIYKGSLSLSYFLHNHCSALMKKTQINSSVVPQEMKDGGPPSGLRLCIAVLAVSLQILVRLQAVSQLAVTGSPRGRCPIRPALSVLGEGLAGGTHRALATRCGGRAPAA